MRAKNPAQLSGFISEWCPASNRKPVRLQIGNSVRLASEFTSRSTALPLSASKPIARAQRPRAFVQSGFNEVRLRSCVENRARTSQKPPDPQRAKERFKAFDDLGALMTRRRFELTDAEWAIIEPLLPNKSRGVPRVMIEKRSTAFCGGSARARPGRMSPSVTVPTPPVTTASFAGERPASGAIFFKKYQRLRRRHRHDRQLLRPGRSDMRPRSRRWLHGTFPRRPDDQNPCACRRRGASRGFGADRRPNPRQRHGRTDARRPQAGRDPSR